MQNAQYRSFDSGKVRELCEAIFVKHGFGPQEAGDIADVLLKADLFGIESHGIQRMIRYHLSLQNGEVNRAAKPDIVHETPVSATIDADKAMGQLVSRYSMKLAIQKAKTCGIGMVAVRNSNHYGIAGYYSLLAAREGLIGVCMTNTEAIMVPTFASKGVLGTNPIAVAMPADPTPFSFDAATTVVPRGKLEVYAKRGDPLPTGWGLAADGGDSTSADEVLAGIIGKLGGGIAPLGGTSELTSGHKGYGFGLICELFTSIMSGGLPANQCVSGEVNTQSHCFWAIDYGIFGDRDQIKRNFSDLLQDIRDAPKAQGRDRIYIHGEKEFESERDKLLSGIPMNEKTFDELHRIAADVGLSASPYIGESFKV